MELDVDGVRLFVDVDGAKVRPAGSEIAEVPTIVVVHDGPGADHLTFKHPAFGPILREHAQLVFFDQRGHGRSDAADASTWRLDRWADDVRGVCEALRIERPIVFGSGFGALVVTRYAARHPGHPSKLILARPVARFEPTQSVEVFRRLAGTEAAETALEFYATPSDATWGAFLVTFMRLFRTLTPSEVAEALLRASWISGPAIHWYGGEAREFDLGDDAAAIRVPTLVLHGEDDPLMPVEGSRELVERIDAELVDYLCFPGVRHSIYADEPRAMEATVAFVDADAV